MLIVGTKKLRALKLTAPISIIVDTKEVVESKSEKLLGVILSNDLTWKEHLHGENWREEGKNDIGLIPQLSQRPESREP